jgi:hypothetical protein
VKTPGLYASGDTRAWSLYILGAPNQPGAVRTPSPAAGRVALHAIPSELLKPDPETATDAVARLSGVKRLTVKVPYRGPISIPTTEEGCRILHQRLKDRLARARAQFEQLARERAGSERLQAQIVDILWRWFIYGRPTESAQSPHPPPAQAAGGPGDRTSVE